MNVNAKRPKEFEFTYTVGEGYYSDGTPIEEERTFTVADYEIIEALANKWGCTEEDISLIIETLENADDLGMLDIDKAYKELYDDLRDYFLEHGYGD